MRLEIPSTREYATDTPAKVGVRVSSPQRVASVATIDLEPGTWEIERRIVLSKGLSITGTALKPDGTPAAGVFVNATMAEVPLGLVNSVPGGIATTDFDGRFTIAGLGEGKYEVSISGPHSPRVPVTLKNGDATDVKGRGLAPGIVRGFVLGPDGRRIASSVVVRLLDPADRSFYPTVRRSLPQIDLPFEARDLVPGRYELRPAPFNPPPGLLPPQATIEVERGQTIECNLKYPAPTTQP